MVATLRRISKEMGFLSRDVPSLELCFPIVQDAMLMIGWTGGVKRRSVNRFRGTGGTKHLLIELRLAQDTQLSDTLLPSFGGRNESSGPVVETLLDKRFGHPVILSRLQSI